MPDAPFDLLIHSTSEVITATGEPTGPAERALAPLTGSVVGIRAGAIAYLGTSAAVPPGAIGPTTRIIDARGGFVGPGFVDPHTHAVFAGDRSDEFEARCRGASYLEIARAGGGIMSTVRATRAASEDELEALALPRLARLLAQGVTTAEVKSGYGLDLPSELKLLRVIRRLAERQPIELVPTLLCAHAIPEERRADREGYVRTCVEEIIPQAAEAKLARFCDAFVEESAFTVEEGRRVLEAGKAHGLIPRLHADQLSAMGASRLAAEIGAATADHLEQVDDAGIAALAGAGVAAVLVPTSTLFLRQHRYAPGRRLRDAGIELGLGTNLNPGSAMSESVALALSLACLENGLTPAEAYWAATRGAANALRLPEAGRIRVGGPADCAVFSCPSYRDLPYRIAMRQVVVVIKRGEVVFS